MLALTAALVAPYFIDWTDYRARFEAEATRVIGQPVKVSGPASARLLPFPSVTFGDVRVGSDPADPLMTVDAFSMDAELAPLLRGEVLIFDMRLDNPSVVLRLDQTGALMWPDHADPRFDPAQVTLENISVTNGALTLIDNKAGRTRTVSAIDARFSARTLLGPWRGEGSFEFDGDKSDFSFSTNTASADGAFRLKTGLVPWNSALSVETEGDLSLQDGFPVYAGQFRLDNESEDAGGDSQQAAGAPDFTTFLATGDFSLTPGAFAVDEYRLAAGNPADPYVVTGKADFLFGAEPRFGFVANGAQIRLEQEATGKSAALALTDRLDSLQGFLDALPLPRVPGNVRIDLPAFVAGDTTIRDIFIDAETAGPQWRLRNLKAELPGRTALEASGLIGRGDGFGFDGDLVLASRQPSGLASWLTGSVDESIRRMSGAGLAAKATMTRRAQIFEGLEIVLGDARFAGRLERISAPGAKPTLTAEMSGGALDLQGLNALVALFVGDGGVNRFASHDVSLAVSAGPVVFGDWSAGVVDTAFRLADGGLEVRRLHVEDFDNADITATGRVTDLFGAPDGQFTVAVQSPDLSLLVGRMADRFPQSPVLAFLAERSVTAPDLFADAQLELAGNASLQDGEPKFTANLGGSSGGLALEGEGEVAPRGDGGTELDFGLSLTADGAASLLALAGIEAFDVPGEGNMTARIGANGLVGKPLAASLDITTPEMTAGWSGNLELAPEDFGANGEMKLEAKDFSSWLLALGYALPGVEAGVPISLSGSLSRENGVWKSPDLAGSLDGDAFTGALTLQDTASERELRGTLALGRLDLPWLASLASGRRADAGMDDPFGLPLLPGHRLEIDVKAQRGEAGWFGPATDLVARLSYAGDKLSLTGFSAATAKGKLSGSADFQNSAGAGLVSAQLRLEDASLAALSPVATSAPLQGAASVSASLSGTGETPQALASSLAGSGVVSWRDATFPGLNADAFASMQKDADAVGFPISAEQIAAIADNHAFAGSFPLGAGEAAFTIAGGVARAANIAVESATARLSGGVALDLGNRGIESEALLAWDADQDAIAGATPEIRLGLKGDWDAPVLTPDYEPLTAFLTQRALEREQARVEALQARLLEKQRLRRETRFYRARTEARTDSEEDRKARYAALQAGEAEKAALAEVIRRSIEAEKALAEEERSRVLEDLPPLQPVQ